jgi:diguanylate cyclase (GGDEF)-like protein
VDGDLDFECRVLLVEDNPGDADLVREYLWGHAKVTQASTLAEAIELANRQVFDVALVDSNLPDAEGVASIQTMGALGAFPILLLTGRDSTELARAAAQFGVQDYLLKGQFKSAQLRRAISSAVFRHETLIQYRTLLSENPDPILIVAADGTVLSANHAAAHAFGRDLDQLIGDVLGIPLAAKGGTEIVLLSKRVMEMRISKVPWKREIAYLAMLRDVTERNRLVHELTEATKRFSQLSVIDPLTGLLNRRGIEEALHRLAQGSSRDSSRVVAMLFDCDNFKTINTLGGYAAGDATLQLVADAITRGMRAPLASVGRIGGDEFLALLTETRFAESVLVAERLRDTISRSQLPLMAKGLSNVTVSVGVASVPPGCSSLKEVIALAESALAASKSGGKDRVSVSESQSELPAVVLSSVEAIIRVPSCIRIARQPIVNRDSETVGFEVLFRGPEHTDFESPATFFAAARRQNLLAAADLAVLRRACELAKGFPKDLQIHFNVFPSTILDTSVAELIEICRPLHGVVLELSEQEFVGDPGLLLPAIRRFRKAGLRIALDDVGFGRSSLETILVLEPEVVKIDRCLVDGISTSPSLHRTTSRLFRSLAALETEIIAEGLENHDDLVLLKELGVHAFQGYLSGRPEILSG